MSLQHPILTFDLVGIALALSKLLQVLLPFAAVAAVRDLPPVRRLLERWAAGKIPDGDPVARQEAIGAWERRFGRLIGFFSWKIGCDLGFFLVTPHSLWQAFTLAGLIPYTIVQYGIYRLFGQKMALSGMWNPLAEERYRTPSLQRRKPVRRLLAMWLHEDFNATSTHVPARRVFLKPFVDFGAVVLSWSLYTVGIFLVESGEWTLAPLWDFPVAEMLGMYVGGTLAFIIGYNLGVGLYLLLARVVGERLWQEPAWAMQTAEGGWAGAFRAFRRVTRIRVYRFVRANGLSLHWVAGVVVGIAMVGFIAKPMAFAVRGAALQAWYAAFGPGEKELAAQARLTRAAFRPETAPATFTAELREYLHLIQAPRPQEEKP